MFFNLPAMLSYVYPGGKQQLFKESTAFSNSLYFKTNTSEDMDDAIPSKERFACPKAESVLPNKCRLELCGKTERRPTLSVKQKRFTTPSWFRTNSFTQPVSFCKKQQDIDILSFRENEVERKGMLILFFLKA